MNLKHGQPKYLAGMVSCQRIIRRSQSGDNKALENSKQNIYDWSEFIFDICQKEIYPQI